MFFFNHTFCGFGLDIDDSAIKATQLTKSRTFSGKNFFTLHGYGKAELPKGIIENGEIKDIPRLTAFILQVISETLPKKIKSNSVVASLPEKKSFLKLFETKAANDVEMKNEIKKRAERDFPLSENELYTNQQIISKKTDGESFKYKILVGAIEKKYADSLTQALRAADLTPIAFETESIATSRSILKLEPTIFDAPISNQAIIDIGSRTSNIIFMQKEAPVFSLSLPTLEKDILKKIQDSINFYNKSFPKNTITKISLSGDGAKLLNLDEMLSKNLELKIKKCDPLINIKTDDAEFQQDALQYATAIGLAMRALILPYP